MQQVEGGIADDRVDGVIVCSTGRRRFVRLTRFETEALLKVVFPHVL